MEDTDVVVAADTLAVNPAQSLWKFTPFTRALLEDMWNVGSVRLEERGSLNVLLGGCEPQSTSGEKIACYNTMDKGWRNQTFAREVLLPGDNQAIKELVVNKSLSQHIKWVPKRTINAYPVGFLGGVYQLGDPDFIVHCPSSIGKITLKDFVWAALKYAGMEVDSKGGPE